MKKKDLELLLAVLGILMVFASYWFAYRNFEAKAAEIETENEDLQATVDRLELLEAKRPDYLASIELMKSTDAEIINSFAPGLDREDQIMYLYNMELVDANEVRVPVVNMSSAQEVPYSGTTTTEEGYELVDDGIRMYRLESSLNLITTNNGLKHVLDYIYDMDNRKAISNINLLVSNDGYLTGSMQLNFYYLSGTDVPYVAPNIQGVPTGTDNFFGVLNGGEYEGRQGGSDDGNESADEGDSESESDSGENE